MKHIRLRCHCKLNWVFQIYLSIVSKKFVTVFGCLFLMVAPVLKRKNSSIKWRYQRFSFKWWRSIAKSLGNDTTGLGTVFLYRSHESHSFITFSTIWNKLLSYIFEFFDKAIKLLLEAYNFQTVYVIFLLFSAYFLVYHYLRKFKLLQFYHS